MDSLKVPTLSFFEYCELLQAKERPCYPPLSAHRAAGIDRREMSEIFENFRPAEALSPLPPGRGFPELVLSSDDNLAQQVMRDDVVDKVLKGHPLPFQHNECGGAGEDLHLSLPLFPRISSR